MIDYTHKIAQITAKFGGVLEQPNVRPLSEEKLKRVENELGCELPQDYRKYLKIYADVFIATTINAPEDDEVIAYSIDCLYGIDTENTQMDVLRNFHGLKGLTPESFLRIGTSNEGFPAISLEGASKGSVYFVNWPNHEETWDRIIFIANSFGQFFGMLEPRSNE